MFWIGKGNRGITEGSNLSRDKDESDLRDSSKFLRSIGVHIGHVEGTFVFSQVMRNRLDQRGRLKRCGNQSPTHTQPYKREARG